MRRFWAVCGLLLALAAGESHAGPFDRRVSMISVEREPTEFRTLAGGRVDGELITVVVPENRGDRKARPLSVRMVRVPARNPSGLPPVLVLADGSTIERARGARWAVYRALSEVTDVVLVDPRGIGESDGPLTCRSGARWEGRVADRKGFTKAYRQAFRECADYWKALGADLRGYTLRESADDLAAIADIFGGSVSVLGSGAGSQLALAFVKYHPDKVERLVLTGTRGLAQTVEYPVQTDLYLERLQLVIDSERGTLDRFPDVKEGIAAFAERLDRDPVTIDAVDASGNTIGKRTISGYFVKRVVADALRNPDQARALLDGIWNADANGDYSYFARQAGQMLPDRVTLEAAPTLIALNQGVGQRRLERVRAQAKRSVVGDAMSFPMPHLASAGRMYRGRDKVRKRPKGRTPLLVFAGTFDGVSPLPSVLKATRGLKRNRTVVTVENGGHDIFFDHPAIVPTITTFLERGEVEDRTLITPPPNVAPRPPRPADPPEGS